MFNCISINEYEDLTMGEDIIYYYNKKNNELLSFPIVYRGIGETLQSPITGYPIRNITKMPYKDLILYHIGKHRKKGEKLKSLPYWGVYVEYIQLKTMIKYDDFMKNNLWEYFNRGYSDRILKPQHILN